VKAKENADIPNLQESSRKVSQVFHQPQAQSSGEKKDKAPSPDLGHPKIEENSVNVRTDNDMVQQKESEDEYDKDDYEKDEYDKPSESERKQSKRPTERKQDPPSIKKEQKQKT